LREHYAEAFARDERIPFLVLVDDDAAAAHAASLRTLNWFQLLHRAHGRQLGRRRSVDTTSISPANG
jgi:hypothetical protein